MWNGRCPLAGALPFKICWLSASIMVVGAPRAIVKNSDIGTNQSWQTVGGRWSGSRILENTLLHQDQALVILWPNHEERWGSPGSVETHRIISVFAQVVRACAVRTSRANLVLQNLVSISRTDLSWLPVLPRISKYATLSLLLFCICIFWAPVREVDVTGCGSCGRILVRWTVEGGSLLHQSYGAGEIVSLAPFLLVFGVALCWKVCVALCWKVCWKGEEED